VRGEVSVPVSVRRDDGEPALEARARGSGTQADVAAGGVHEPDHVHGATHALSILSSLLVGLILAFVPWWPSLWDTNFFLPPHPTLRVVLLSAFTRGAVTGLGLVNILLALHDAKQLLIPSVERT
jgi:hypothetical protein